jgi:hypothetical protein
MEEDIQFKTGKKYRILKTLFFNEPRTLLEIAISKPFVPTIQHAATKIYLFLFYLFFNLVHSVIV